MDQRPRDLPPRTDWERRRDARDNGSWSVVPILVVVAILAIGAWLLFGNDAKPPSTTTSESTPHTAPSSGPAPTPAPTPMSPPSNTAPAPATKP